MTTATRPTQRQKPARAIHPLGGNLFKIEVGANWDVYSIVPIECQLGGVAFSVAALTVERDAPLYHVHVSRPGMGTCDCAGFTFKEKCKHRDGILHLQKFGLLPGPTATTPAAKDA